MPAPELMLEVLGAGPAPGSAAPTIVFRVRAAARAGFVEAAVLRAQIGIVPARRRYTAAQREALIELFGPPERWADGARPLTWTHAALVLPGFTGACEAELHAPCSYDLHIAATRYFEIVSDEAIPLTFSFSGTVFYRDQSGELQTAPVSWAIEAEHRMSPSTWRAAVDRHYPQSGWIVLRRDVLERLAQVRAGCVLPTWDHAVEELLELRSRHAGIATRETTA